MYSNIANLVLRARSERIGCAVKYWSNGVLEYRVWWNYIWILYGWCRAENNPPAAH
jgi:hypothetical protein